MRRIVAMTAALSLVVAMLVISGCSSSSTKPEVQKPRYPETTAKETVISNLVLSYKDRNIEQYSKLLHEDYIWFNSPLDVTMNGLPETYSRTEDIQHVGNMFLAALSKHQNSTLWLDKLELEISTSPTPDDLWTPFAGEEGSPCADCWETTRDYSLTIVFKSGDLTILSNARVSFVIVGVDAGGQKVYRILRCDDLLPQ